jgi:hypothetical protein
MTDVIKYQVPIVGKVDRLLNLINNNIFYFVLGKSTQWEDDSEPPSPSEEIELVAEPIIIKQAKFVNPAVLSDCGDIDFRDCGFTNLDGQKLTLVDLENTSISNLKKLNPQYLYVSVEITPADLPVDSWRIVGLFNDVIFKSDVNPNKVFFLPEEVQEYGSLYWASYSTPLFKQVNKITVLEVLLNI